MQLLALSRFPYYNRYRVSLHRNREQMRLRIFQAFLNHFARMSSIIHSFNQWIFSPHHELISAGKLESHSSLKITFPIAHTHMTRHPAKQNTLS